MNDIVAFTFDSHELRSITNANGDPWFVLKDVLEAMGSSTTVTAAVEAIKQGLGDGFVAGIPVHDARGQLRDTTIVAEAGATYLVSRSNTEEGRRLNRFIFTEVLPQIRKTGAYRPRPLSPAEILIQQGQMMLAIEQEQARQAEAQRQLDLRQEATERRLDQIETAADHFTVIGWYRYAKLAGSLPLADAARMGRIATKFCREHEVPIGEVPDPRFGTAHTYPKWVLDELFLGAPN